jgi:hypothetical protein
MCSVGRFKVAALVNLKLRLTYPRKGIISKATIQKAFAKPVDGYHNCELVFYKHNQVKVI